MRGLIARLYLLLCLLFSLPSVADEKIVTVLPILHSMNQALLSETEVIPVYLPPKRLPVSRITPWVQQKSRPAFAEIGEVTAFVTIASVWPELDFYPSVRMSNIRAIPIDAATEISVAGSKVSLSRRDIADHTYFWLAPDNLITMSQIMARDFSRIWPKYADKIRHNQIALQNQVRGFSLQLDQLILEHELMSVCLLDPKLEPLARATLLPIEFKDKCASDALFLNLANKKGVSDRSVWLVNTANKPLKNTFEGWLSYNLSSLETALK
jgi:hypothetical protein